MISKLPIIRSSPHAVSVQEHTPVQISQVSGFPATTTLSQSEPQGPVQGPVAGPSKDANYSTNGLEEGLGNSTDERLGSGASSPYTAERDALRGLTQPPSMSSSIPPSPPGSPNPAANAKFARFLELKAKGVHFNVDLAGKTSFQNPSLLSNMLARAGITEQEQYASTIPEDIWSVRMFPDWAYKEGLIQQQRVMTRRLEVEKKAQSAAGKRAIDFVAQGHSSSTPSGTERQQLHTSPKRKRP